MIYISFCFQAEDGIRDLVRSRGLGDVYKRQPTITSSPSFNVAIPYETENPMNLPIGARLPNL